MVKKALLAVSVAAACGTLYGQTAASPCNVPSQQTSDSVREYAMKKYHVASVARLTTFSGEKANPECYWKYHVLTSSPRQEFFLYLSPDRRYLSTTLFDRLSDPLAEERAQREQLNQTLLANQPPSRGPEHATVTIVEFSDFQCPYCSRLTEILEKEVLPSDSDIRVVFKNFPLSIHPWARAAAQSAECAAMQSSDAFWKVHDYVFSSQKDFTADNVEDKIAAFSDAQQSIDHKSFHDCIERGMAVGPVMKDEDLGRKLGVQATPTLFINGSKVPSIRDAAQLKQLIAAARAGQSPETAVASSDIKGANQ